MQHTSWQPFFLLSVLLVYNHCNMFVMGQGVLLSKLVEDFFNMKEEILSRDFDLGFSGNSEDVVMHALSLLGNCVNVTSTNRNTEFIIAPSNTVPALFELNFYSNGLFHVFIADAIIGIRSKFPQIIFFTTNLDMYVCLFNYCLYFKSQFDSVCKYCFTLLWATEVLMPVMRARGNMTKI